MNCVGRDVLNDRHPILLHPLNERLRLVQRPNFLHNLEAFFEYACHKGLRFRDGSSAGSEEATVNAFAKGTLY